MNTTAVRCPITSATNAVKLFVAAHAARADNVLHARCAARTHKHTHAARMQHGAHAHTVHRQPIPHGSSSSAHDRMHTHLQRLRHDEKNVVNPHFNPHPSNELRRLTSDHGLLGVAASDSTARHWLVACVRTPQRAHHACARFHKTSFKLHVCAHQSLRETRA